ARPRRPQRFGCDHRLDHRGRSRPAPHSRAQHPSRPAVYIVLRRRRPDLRGRSRGIVLTPRIDSKRVRSGRRTDGSVTMNGHKRRMIRTAVVIAGALLVTTAMPNIVEPATGATPAPGATTAELRASLRNELNI